MFLYWLYLLAVVTTPVDSVVGETNIVLLTIPASGTMSNRSIPECLEHAIAEQKSSLIHISGTHDVVLPLSPAVEEMVDFDFEAEISGFIDLDMIEFTNSATPNEVHILVAGDDRDNEKDLVQKVIEKLEDVGASTYDKIMISDKITNRDDMALNLQMSANHARYGGRVQFEQQDVAEAPTYRTNQKPTSDDHWIRVSLVWKYKSWTKPKREGQTRRTLPAGPNIHTGPRPWTWNHRIQHAMVDGQRGMISLDDEIDKTVPMMKAVRKFALHEPLAMHGQFGTSRIHKWGLDEPNEEPPYIGNSHFGRGIRSLPGDE